MRWENKFFLRKRNPWELFGMRKNLFCFQLNCWQAQIIEVNEENPSNNNHIFPIFFRFKVYLHAKMSLFWALNCLRLSQPLDHFHNKVIQFIHSTSRLASLSFLYDIVSVCALRSCFFTTELMTKIMIWLINFQISTSISMETLPEICSKSFHAAGKLKVVKKSDSTLCFMARH